MRSEYSGTRLGALLSFANGKSSPSRREHNTVPVYGSNGLIGFCEEANSPGNTIIIGRVGSYCGSVHFSDTPCWVTDNAIRASTINGNNAYYAYSLVKSIGLNGWRSGSGQPLLNQTILSGVPISLPSIEDQDNIAFVLRRLEDRIENNRALATNLESIARAIFKSWFVDFDPVRAKATGQQPDGLDPDIAALFPDRLVDSEIGEIPEGWAAGSVSDVARVISGRSYKSKELQESDTALVTLKSFNRGGGFRSDGFKSYTGKFKAEQIIEPGECVMACTDVTQQAEVIARPALVRASPDHETLVVSLDAVIIRPFEDSISNEYLYLNFLSERHVSNALAYVNGSTVLHLNKKALPALPFLIANDDVHRAFNEIVQTLFKRMALLEKESNVLSELRDTLLPRLISGKLRVADAEQAIANAV